MPTTLPLTPERVARAKNAYTTRLVRPESMSTLLTAPGLRPEAGDLVLARVEVIGQHQKIERPDGRKSALFPGDEIIVVFGNRYAPDQFEAEVPPDLGPCQLVAGGGLAAGVLCSHFAMEEATAISPLGLVADEDGRRINLRDWCLAAPPVPRDQPRPTTIAVVGSSMNAGKTTTAAYLINGLAATGRAVGAAKVTGTGAGNDVWFMADAGASPVLDFTHAGYPSTYHCSAEEVRSVMRTLSAHLADSGVDTVVLEVADGMFQPETAALLTSPEFADGVNAVVFAGTDALSAVAGVQQLRGLGLPTVAVSGLFTASPLACREARSALTGVVVLAREEICHPSVAELLVAEARAQRLPHAPVQLARSA